MANKLEPSQADKQRQQIHGAPQEGQLSGPAIRKQLSSPVESLPLQDLHGDGLATQGPVANNVAAVVRIAVEAAEGAALDVVNGVGNQFGGMVTRYPLAIEQCVKEERVVLNADGMVTRYPDAIEERVVQEGVVLDADGMVSRSPQATDECAEEEGVVMDADGMVSPSLKVTEDCAEEESVVPDAHEMASPCPEPTEECAEEEGVVPHAQGMASPGPEASEECAEEEDAVLDVHGILVNRCTAQINEECAAPDADGLEPQAVVATEKGAALDEDGMGTQTAVGDDGVPLDAIATQGSKASGERAELEVEGVQEQTTLKGHGPNNDRTRKPKLNALAMEFVTPSRFVSGSFARQAECAQEEGIAPEAHGMVSLCPAATEECAEEESVGPDAHGTASPCPEPTEECAEEEGVVPHAQGMASPGPEASEECAEEEDAVLDVHGILVNRCTAQINEECAAPDADGLEPQAVVATEKGAALDEDGMGTQTAVGDDGVPLDAIATQGSKASGERAELEVEGVQEQTTLKGHGPNNDRTRKPKLNALAMEFVTPSRFVSGSFARQAECAQEEGIAPEAHGMVSLCPAATEECAEEESVGPDAHGTASPCPEPTEECAEEEGVVPHAQGMASPGPEASEECAEEEDAVLDVHGILVNRCTAQINEECAAPDADGLEPQAVVATEKGAALDEDGMGTQTAVGDDGVPLDAIATQGSKASGERAELEVEGVQEQTTLKGHGPNNDRTRKPKLNALAMEFVTPSRFVSGSFARQAECAQEEGIAPEAHGMVSLCPAATEECAEEESVGPDAHGTASPCPEPTEECAEEEGVVPHAQGMASPGLEASEECAEEEDAVLDVHGILVNRCTAQINEECAAPDADGLETQAVVATEKGAALDEDGMGTQTAVGDDGVALDAIATQGSKASGERAELKAEGVQEHTTLQGHGPNNDITRKPKLNALAMEFVTPSRFVSGSFARQAECAPSRFVSGSLARQGAQEEGIAPEAHGMVSLCPAATEECAEEESVVPDAHGMATPCSEPAEECAEEGVVPDAQEMVSPSPEASEECAGEEGVVLDARGILVTRCTKTNEHCAALHADSLETEALLTTTEEGAALDEDGMGTQTAVGAEGVALDAIAMVPQGCEASGEGAELEVGVEEETALEGHDASNESLRLYKLNPLAIEFVPRSRFVSDSPARQEGSSSTGNGHRNDRHQHREDSILEDKIRRTVYILDINQQLTETQLAAIFISKGCGQVVDCRISGYKDSPLGSAFVEFVHEYGALRALRLTGMMLDSQPLTVLPSKTAMLPVNPRLLPRSDDERETCASTIYCTNIDRRATEMVVKRFFEFHCGQVARLRLLMDSDQLTKIAFVEFLTPESAVAALSCRGALLGSRPIRVSPSKTQVRSRADCRHLHGSRSVSQ